MGLWWFLLIVLVVGLVWAVVVWSRGSGLAAPAQQVPRTPREILDERLARGEIDIEEYGRRRAALEQQPQTPSPA